MQDLHSGELTTSRASAGPSFTINGGNAYPGFNGKTIFIYDVGRYFYFRPYCVDFQLLV